ncbi:hypothetical protein C8Q70DRAFT_968957 [Cubamyces menziesii]|nr:hypothetical protein C8Q70DRAFT_968957 [Cubamyces menziesii]
MVNLRCILSCQHPIWIEPASGKTELKDDRPAPVLKEENEDKSAVDLTPDVTHGYKLVYPDKPGGVLNLLSQHPDVQEVARLSFPRIERELVVTHAFPNTLIRRRFVREALMASAEECGFDRLKAQILQSEHFAWTLGAIPNQRISTFRKELKELAQNSVLAHYSLIPGDCGQKVDWLLSELIYIYPKLDYERNQGSWEKPYGHPLINYVIQQGFFDGPDAVGNRYPEIFKSSLRERENECELPMAMVALAGTVVHAGLLQWKSGQYTKVEFSGNSFVDKYREHITFMTHLETTNLRAYHTMMHNLYKDALGVVSPLAAPAPQMASAISRLVINLMEIA